MSQENVEIVRAMLVATGPETDRDEWLEEFFDPEIEWQILRPTRAQAFTTRTTPSVATRPSTRTPGTIGVGQA
jgi:hypothetical protein